MAGGEDDLRRKILQEMEPEPEDPNDVLVRRVQSDKMFGMTAAERMFVSIGCFLLTCLSGFTLLLIMEKIALP